MLNKEKESDLAQSSNGRKFPSTKKLSFRFLIFDGIVWEEVTEREYEIWRDLKKVVCEC